MKDTDAIRLIETILTSMRTNPAQFQFAVNITTVGAMGVGGSGGHGIVAIANAPGSTGFSASASAPSQMTIQIAEQRANQELNTQFAKIDQVLQQIVAELKSKIITTEKIDNFLQQLKQTWFPKVLVSVITFILEKVVESQI
jgi:hypothetical protein